MSMIGKELSHFRILSKIGEGGMGVVYEAEDLDLGRRVAIKVLPPHLVGDKDRRQRFVREARTAAAVTHPNIATIHEIGEADGMIFIAMEVCHGPSLRELITQGPLPIKEAVRLGRQIAEGMSAAHTALIAHRDLKPDNIIVTEDGHAKILDFGLARLMEDQSASAPADTSASPDPSVPSNTTEAATLPTGENRILGSPAYMSPEQVRGEDLDFRTDIFSFGSTFYEMVTGKPAFRSTSASATANDIVNKNPLAASSSNPEVPSALQWILDKCLEKDPAQRYQDTRDLVVDLRHLFPEGTTKSTPAYQNTMAANSRGSWRALVFIGMVLVVAALGSIQMFRGGSESAPANAAVDAAPQENSLAVFPFDNLKSPEDPERLGQIMQELLITDLSGLEPLKVFSSQRIADAKGQALRNREQVNSQLAMDDDGVGKSSDKATSDKATSDKATSDEVAREIGAKSMLTGSLSQLGEIWILTAQITDVETGTVVKSKRLDGLDLYRLVDQLTSEIQKDFSLGTPTDIASKPISEKTSESMDAWQYYLSGVEYLDNENFDAAVSELTKSVEADPTFGRAWYNLGVATWWLYSDTGAGADHLAKLLDEQLYASERERRMAEGMLLVVNNQWSKAVPVLESLTLDYPDEKYAWYGFGEALFHFPGSAKLSQSRRAFERAVSLAPEFQLPYRHIFDVMHREQQYEQAVQRAQLLIKREPSNPVWHRLHVTSVAMMDDREALELALGSAVQSCPTVEDMKEIYRAAAEGLGSRGALDLARGFVERALEIDPDHDDLKLQRLLMSYYWQGRDYDPLEKLIHQRLAKDSSNNLYLQDLYNIYMAKAKYQEAHDLAEELVERDPTEPRWYRRLASCKIFLKHESRLPSVLNSARESSSSPDDQRALQTSIGWAFSQVGDHNKAIEYFNRALAVDPDEEYANIYMALGIQEFSRGRFDHAENWLSKVRALGPDDLRVIAQSANVAMARGDFPQALNLIDRAIAAAPPSELFAFLKTSTLIMNDRLDDVDAIILKAKDMKVASSQRWDALFNRPGDVPLGIGWAYLLKGYDQRALKSFQIGETLELNSRDPRAYEGLGWTFLVQGDYANAKLNLEKALTVGYQHLSCFYALAANSLSQNQPKEAEEYLQRALQKGPGHVAVQRMFSRIYAAQDQWTQALKFAESAVGMDSSRASLEVLAWVLTSGKIDPQRGMNIAHQALHLPTSYMNLERQLPYHAGAEHTLGVAFMQQGDADAAVIHLEKAVALQPSRQSIHEALLQAREMPRGTH